MYDEPEPFRPERFIDGIPFDPREIIFGFADTNTGLAVPALFSFSRRICVSIRMRCFCNFGRTFESFL